MACSLNECYHEHVGNPLLFHQIASQSSVFIQLIVYVRLVYEIM